VFLLLLSSLFRAPNVPVPAGALFAFAVFAAYRPAAALLAVPILVPIATWFGRYWSGLVAWPETVAIAYLAGYAARTAVERETQPADALVYAMHGTIAVVVGSIAVEFFFLPATLGGTAFRAVLWQLVTRDYFIGTGGFETVDAAMRLIEGILLAHAGTTFAKRSPAFGGSMARAVVIGASAAAAVTLWRLWQSAVRADDPVLTFLRFLTTLRFNAHHGDVNAAGSFYAMALLPALALMLSRTRWIAAAVAITLALMLTGSRTAFLAALVALGIAWFRVRPAAAVRPPFVRSHALRGAALAVLVVTCAGLLYTGITRNLTPAGQALELRREFTLTGLRMFASRPVFGVGVGEYWRMSADFSGPALHAKYRNENAHNNYLQLLAELGAIGFVVFGALLALSARCAVRLLSRDAPAVAAAVAAGLLAFLVTWIGGHPLLVDDAALTFWLLWGTAAGWGATLIPGRARSTPGKTRLVAAVLLVVVAASIPARARMKFNEANLEHMGIGLSPWYVAADDIRYRTAGATSTVFAPGDAAAIKILLRALQPGSVVDVQLYLDGRHINGVHVPSDVWRVVNVPLTQAREGRRFLTLQFRVTDAPAAASQVLMIGKVEPISR
jgi:O-antigen ligase